MWLCTFVIKVFSKVADDLYQVRNINFIISIGSITENLVLSHILEENEYYNN